MDANSTQTRSSISEDYNSWIMEQLRATAHQKVAAKRKKRRLIARMLKPVIRWVLADESHPVPKPYFVEVNESHRPSSKLTVLLSEPRR